MQKACSFQRKMIEYILVIVSLTLTVGTVLVVSLVTKKLSQQNEQYTLSAFVKTDVELENQKQKMDKDFISLSASLTQNGIPDTTGAFTLPYTKSLVNISNLFDQFLDYRMIGLFTGDSAIICSPVRSFSVYFSGDPVFDSLLYENILHGDKDYGTAYMYEFVDSSHKRDSSLWHSRIVYFRKPFLYGEQRCYLLIGLDENVIHQSFLHLEQGFNSIYIVGQQNEILSSTQADMFRQTLDYPLEPDPGRVSYKKTLGDTEYQIIPQALGIYDWSIVNQYPTFEYMRDVNRMSLFIIAIFIGCLFAVGLSVTLVIRRISSPLNELSLRLKSFSSTGLRSPRPMHTDNITEFDVLNKSFLQMADDIQRLVAQQKEEEELKNQLRIQALMAQINPHFICNALNTVKVMAEISGTRNVATMISHICQYISPAFRTNRNRWSYAEEYAFLEDYIYILEICFSAKIEIDCRFDPYVREDILPRFLIQPLVENCISHGMTPDRTLRIEITVQKETDGRVSIHVTDDGIGFTPEELENRRQMLAQMKRDTSADLQAHIGLQNIKQRLNHYYPECHEFHIDSVQDQGTSITIRIPLRTDDAAAVT